MIFTRGKLNHLNMLHSMKLKHLQILGVVHKLRDGI